MLYVIKAMKKLLIVISILLSSFKIKAQTFKLDDSIFQVGDSLVNNIFFHFNKGLILEESKPFMDSLATLLITFKALKIEIGHHTDQRGSEAFNLKLSEYRAIALKDYLVFKGVDSKQLIQKGFGEKQPIIKLKAIDQKKDKQEKEKLYTKNRRSVFKIISITLK